MSKKASNRYLLASAQSLSASFNSTPTIIMNQDNISYQINVTTTNSQGTWKVQASDDYQVPAGTTQIENPGNWVDLTLGGGTPNVNAANTIINISLNQTTFAAIRLAYTSTTAGTGHCDIWVMEKRLGG